MELTCSACGEEHVHPYVYCQTCQGTMNPLGSHQGPQIQVPIHFKRANEEGYTMASIRRENDEGFRRRDKNGDW